MKSKANDYMGTGKPKPRKESQVKALQKRLKGSKFKKSYKQEATKTPIYKSGIMNGKPMNYGAMKKGIITSLD